ncbi:MAG: DUF4349 domain-containing protein, partial [Clostridiales Family XIII bacterium]|nr:DUF4349 domain-containing protein [Clostridiales Family XIII bacterium]
MKNINKKISRKFLWALAGLVAVAIFAVACSSAGSAGGSGSAGASSASDSGASEAYDGGTEDYRWASEDSAWDDSIMEMDGEEYLEAAPSADAGGSAAAEEAPAAAYDEAVSFARTGSASLAAKGQKITFSASFSINTDHYDEDYRRINDLVNNAGGYIASENSN